jgi:hypothetical protein
MHLPAACVGPHSRQNGPVMWGFLIGLYLAVLIYPFIEERQQRKIEKEQLTRMRAHHASGHRWDVAKGQWLDE